MQLDLFQPRDYEFDFRVILTNKVVDDAEAVMDFHHGRGSQEGLIGEAKSCAQLDYIPSRRLAVNQTFTVSAMLAHNSVASCRCRPKIAPAATPRSVRRAGYSRGCIPFATWC